MEGACCIAEEEIGIDLGNAAGDIDQGLVDGQAGLGAQADDGVQFAAVFCRAAIEELYLIELGRGIFQFHTQYAAIADAEVVAPPARHRTDPGRR